MPRDLSSRHTYVSGGVRYHDLAYTASQDDNVPRSIEHSHFHELDRGNLGYVGAVTWPTASMAISVHPIEQMIAISPHGDVKLFGSGQERDEQIRTTKGEPSKRGPLRQVRTIGRRTFAVGMGRQVYRRDGENHWTCLDQQLQPLVGEVKGFESIDGFSESDLYAVGWDGEIWHFDGSVWTQQRSPVAVVLTRVLCAGDGNVYATGRQGLLLRGGGAGWDVVEHDSLHEDVQDMAWYEGRLYLSTRRQLWTLSGNRLAPIDFGEDVPETCGHLSAADGVLWSFGAKDIMAFDGKKWARVD